MLLLSALLGALSVWVVATRFAMNTDVVPLFPEDLPWRQAEIAMDRAFPQRTELIAAVIDGATPDVADRAAAALAAALAPRTALFREVWRPGAEPFFRRSALLFLDEPELRQVTERLIAAQPLLGTLSADPSLRGVAPRRRADGRGHRARRRRPGHPAPAVARLDGGRGRRRGRPRSRRSTGPRSSPAARRTRWNCRRFLLLRPVPDFSALAPTAAATAAVRGGRGARSA